MSNQPQYITAQELIEQAKSARVEEPLQLDEMLPKMSPFLTYFIELILADFCYLEHPKSNIAIAARAIAAMAAYFEAYQEE